MRKVKLVIAIVIAIILMIIIMMLLAMFLLKTRRKESYIESYITFNYNCNGVDYQQICELENNKINCEVERPSCEGYVFIGWYKSNEYASQIDLTQEFDGNEILYAKWETEIDIDIDQTYKIFFDLNDGNESDSLVIHEIKYGEELPNIKETPSREGYTFMGWYDSRNGGNQYYNSQNIAIRKYDRIENVTLYAQWKINTLSIEYNGNRGTWGNNKSELYSVNESGSVVSKLNNKIYLSELNYGDKLIETGLIDYNGNWFKWNKEGYKINQGKEYFIENGKTKTEIDQSKVYTAVELANYAGCDLSKSNCKITVKVNWQKEENNGDIHVEEDEINNVSCIGEYENGDGLATLNVVAANNDIVNYQFKLDNKVVKDSSSPKYEANSIYTLLINPEVIVTNKNGARKVIQCEVKHMKYAESNSDGYYFAKQSSYDKKGKIQNPFPKNQLEYYLYIPSSAGNTDKKMPLIIGFHGGIASGISDDSPRYSLLDSRAKKPEAIVIAAANVKDSGNWETGIYEARDIVYSIVKKYNIDLERIVVNGGSQGGYATLLFGFLEEQIIYYAEDDISLDTVARQYGTTTEEIINYNKKINDSSRVQTTGVYGIKFKDSKKMILKKGSQTILRAKNSNDQRSIVSLLIPNSPAANASRCAFNASGLKYSSNENCPSVPAYTIKTPIWIIVSSEEPYDRIKNFAKTLTDYYENNGNNIRFTMLKNTKKVNKAEGKIYDGHNTQLFIAIETSILQWAIKQKAGTITMKNNSEIRELEKSLKCVLDVKNNCIDTFDQIWTTIGQT